MATKVLASYPQDRCSPNPPAPLDVPGDASRMFAGATKSLQYAIKDIRSTMTSSPKGRRNVAAAIMAARAAGTGPVSFGKFPLKSTVKPVGEATRNLDFRAAIAARDPTQIADARARHILLERPKSSSGERTVPPRSTSNPRQPVLTKLPSLLLALDSDNCQPSRPRTPFRSKPREREASASPPDQAKELNLGTAASNVRTRPTQRPYAEAVVGTPLKSGPRAASPVAAGAISPPPVVTAPAPTVIPATPATTPAAAPANPATVPERPRTAGRPRTASLPPVEVAEHLPKNFFKDEPLEGDWGPEHQHIEVPEWDDGRLRAAARAMYEQGMGLRAAAARFKVSMVDLRQYYDVMDDWAMEYFVLGDGSNKTNGRQAAVKAPAAQPTGTMVAGKPRGAPAAVATTRDAVNPTSRVTAAASGPAADAAISGENPNRGGEGGKLASAPPRPADCGIKAMGTAWPRYGIVIGAGKPGPLVEDPPQLVAGAGQRAAAAQRPAADAGELAAPALPVLRVKVGREDKAMRGAGAGGSGGRAGGVLPVPEVAEQDEATDGGWDEDTWADPPAACAPDRKLLRPWAR